MTFPHLKDRAAKLADSLDLPADLAEWLAVAALHSGCFLRSQLLFFKGVDIDETTGADRKSMTRTIRHLTTRQLIVEKNLNNCGLLSRITNKTVYRLIDAGDIRHRRQASWPLTFRRLLALDYVLEHPHLPWLPTEHEKVACFDELGIDHAHLPRRVWNNATGHTVRLFANKHPIALDPHSKQAWFIYTDSEESSPKGVRNWRREHDPLWSDLDRLGFALFIVHASYNTRLESRVSRVFSSWMKLPQSTTSSSQIEADLLSVQKAIESNDDQALEVYGGFNGALRAASALQYQLSNENVAPYAATYSTWLSERLMQATSNPNPSGSHSRNS